MAFFYGLLSAITASAGDLPNHKLTPGVARKMSVATICSTRWGRDRRHVTASMKRQVFVSYHSPKCAPDSHGRTIEYDHLISRENGGADAVKNLWPECYSGRYGASVKDRLENRLHREVCAKHITLKQAQTWLQTDWRIAYRKYFGAPK